MKVLAAFPWKQTCGVPVLLVMLVRLATAVVSAWPVARAAPVTGSQVTLGGARLSSMLPNL